MRGGWTWNSITEQRTGDTTMATRELIAGEVKRAPTHPGEVLREDVLPALRLSVTEAATVELSGSLGSLMQASSVARRCVLLIGSSTRRYLSTLTTCSSIKWLVERLKRAWPASYANAQIPRSLESRKTELSYSSRP